MIRGMRRDRLWAFGGALAAAGLLALAWVFFIGPQYAQASSLHEEAGGADRQVTSLQRDLVGLRREKSHLRQYQDELARLHLALPSAPASSDFLRELQAVGTSTGVSVTGLSVAAPASVATAAKPTYALQIALTLAGSAAKVELFLDQLQQVQPRAVLITTANMVPDGPNGSLSDGVTLTLALQAFFTPPAGYLTAGISPGGGTSSGTSSGGTSTGGGTADLRAGSS